MIDWLIKDAFIVDGTGTPRFSGDIAIRGEKIAAVGAVKECEPRHVIEARGKIASPGFVDMHSHSDVLFLNGSPPLHKIFQGVTTELIGQDGISLAPLTETSTQHIADLIEPLAGHLDGGWKPWDVRKCLKTMREKGASVNAVTLVGHCNLRLAAMGHKMGEPSRDQLRQMGEMLAIGLRGGAVGLSLGLIYPPSSYSNTNELIYLGRVVRDYDAILVAHIRNEQEKLFQALDEMIAVGKESGCRIHISHLKCMGRDQWGKMPAVLRKLEQAAAEGIDLSFDQYPYNAACTTLSVLLPGWVTEGGWQNFHRRLKHSGSRERILSELQKSIEARGGPSAITLASVQRRENQGKAGKTVEELSRLQGITAEEAALEILQSEESHAVAIYHSIAEEDVEQAMAHPLHTVGSDGILGVFPHPRTYGTFPRIISHFCGKQKVFTLEEAIRRMTSAPAKRLGLRNRGTITPAAYADVILFDLQRFKDNATYGNPKQPATGLDWMFVNGKPLIREGKLENVSPGQIIMACTSTGR